MRPRQWFILIGIMVALGTIKVAQHTAIWQKAYALGRQADAFHVLETETQWLNTQVAALRSPAHLITAMREERMNLVAWTELPSASGTIQLVHSIGGALTDRHSDIRRDLAR